MTDIFYEQRLGNPQQSLDGVVAATKNPNTLVVMGFVDITLDAHAVAPAMLRYGECRCRGAHFSPWRY